MKNNKKTFYKKISKGVYQNSPKTYRVRKTIFGEVRSYTFTNKAMAIRFYKNWDILN